MSIRIIKAGIQTSLQDYGRKFHRVSGVPVSGAIDRDSFRIANILAGNPPGSTAIEFTLHGAALMAETKMIIAFCGGGAELYINQQKVISSRPVLVQPYSFLDLRPAFEGCRSYLAVSGGLVGNSDLGSTSTYAPATLGGLNGGLLKSGDMLSIKDAEVFNRMQKLPWRTDTSGAYMQTGWGFSQQIAANDTETVIRIVKGPEWHYFRDTVSDTLFGNSYLVSENSNRMGYRLKGEQIPIDLKTELISTAVSPGTIQVTPEGELLMLMADAQTTGGYPRIAHVAMADLHVCAQLRPGRCIKFVEISALEAEQLHLKNERQLNLFKEIVLINLQL